MRGSQLLTQHTRTKLEFEVRLQKARLYRQQVTVVDSIPLMSLDLLVFRPLLLGFQLLAERIWARGINLDIRNENSAGGFRTENSTSILLRPSRPAFCIIRLIHMTTYGGVELPTSACTALAVLS